jgi:pimeloyl-ACP methyl ester carboxylesterase
VIEERDIVVRGRRVHYLCAGSGPLVLLLHALGETAGSWRWVLPALAPNFTVLAPDLPGFGHSERLVEQPTPARLARAAAEFLDACTSGPVIVVGNSFGGSAAIQTAVHLPQRVAGLLLVASTGLGRYVHPALCALALPGYGDFATAFGKTHLGAAQRAWLRVPLLFRNPRLAPPAWLAEQRRVAQLPDHLDTTLAALRAQVSAFGQRNLMLADLFGLDIPVLLVWGANDMVLPVAQAYAAIRQLRNGHLRVIPNCGHLPQVERPERFIEAVDQFLRTAR